MELTIRERFLLLSLLPREGSIVTLRIVRDLSNELAPSDGEIEELGIEQDEGTGDIHWDVEATVAAGPKECSLGKQACRLVEDALKRKSEEEGLTVEYLDLYDKFVEEE